MKNRYLKFFLAGVLICAGLVIVAYEVLWNISRAQWVREFNHRYDSLIAVKKITPPITVNDTAFLNLQNQIAFLKARIGLTNAHPLGISISLPDSLARLEIRGVTVHSSRIQKFRADRMIRSVHPYYLSQELSVPLEVVSYHATVPREPIMIKVAPKDTLEASSTALIADTAFTATVCFQLVLANQFRITVLETHSASWWLNKDISKFILSVRWPVVKNNFTRLFRLQRMEVFPEIILIMSRNDAKTLLRALPENGRIALRIS